MHAEQQKSDEPQQPHRPRPPIELGPRAAKPKFGQDPWAMFRLTLAFLAAGTACLCVTKYTESPAPAFVGMGLLLVAASPAWRAHTAARAKWKQLRREGAAGRERLLIRIPAYLGLAYVAAGGWFFVLNFLQMFTRGRQLRAGGKVQLPPVCAGGGWDDLRREPAIAGEVRRAVAAQWRENGRTEHASVAALARLTLDLVGLGAPPRLIAAANRDSLDEIRHAELCFSLARALDGSSQSPGPFRAGERAKAMRGPRRLKLVRLAVNSLVDGALQEGVSARVLARLARRCADPDTAAILRELSADEARHAANAWDVVEWCVETGGDAVVLALLGAVAMMPESMASSLPDAARDGGWERHGIHGEALEREEFDKKRGELARRVDGLVERRLAVAA